MPQITWVAHLHVFGVVPTMNSKSIHHLLPEVNYVLFVCLGLHQALVEQHERAQFLMRGMLFTTLDHNFDMVDQHFRYLSKIGQKSSN